MLQRKDKRKSQVRLNRRRRPDSAEVVCRFPRDTGTSSHSGWVKKKGSRWPEDRTASRKVGTSCATRSHHWTKVWKTRNRKEELDILPRWVSCGRWSVHEKQLKISLKKHGNKMAWPPVRCRDWSASSSGMGDGVNRRNSEWTRRKKIAAQSEVAYRPARSSDTNSKNIGGWLGRGQSKKCGAGMDGEKKQCAESCQKAVQDATRRIEKCNTPPTCWRR